MVYPEQFTDGSIQIVQKDGKKYLKRAVFKLSHFTYEPVTESNKLELPSKLPDIRRDS